MIRYDKKFNSEIRRVVSNFNRKINRLQKEERDLLLPEKVSIRELKANVYSRSDLRRELRKLERFSKRGIEQTITTPGGVKISKYELEETARETKRIKTSLTRQIKRISNITPTVFGVRQSATYAQMGLEQLSNLKARRQTLEKDIRKLDKENFREFQKQLNINIQKERYRTQIFMDNYIDKMLFSLVYFIGYDKNKIEHIKQKLMELDEKQFLKLFETDEGIRAIRDYYPEIHRRNMNKIQDDVTNLYDALYENINSIVEDYKKDGKSNKEIVDKKKLSNPSQIKNISSPNGYIVLYENGNKVGKFSTGEQAYSYIKKNKLKNVSYSLEK